MSLPRVALVGVTGYSRVHLEHLLEAHVRGELEFVAAVALDQAQAREDCRRIEQLGGRLLPDFPALLVALPALRPDLVIVPTPIPMHAAMSSALLAAGVNVLVEKPLAATVGECAQVAAAAAASGRVAAVGYQYLHAPEVQALKQRLLAGEIGAVRNIAVHAAWPRSHSYYARNNWAGRLHTADGWVLDSPVANAMAHFFMLMLFLAGETPAEGARVTELTAELYRAQAIESFDTAVLSLRTENGCQLSFHGTHSSREVARPILVVTGEHGRAEWVQDRHATLTGGAGEWRQAAEPEAATRVRMLRDVLARVQGRPAFICTPEFATEQVRCIDALHEFVPIAGVPAASRGQCVVDGEIFTYIEGLDESLRTAFAQRTGLHAAGVPWAVPPVSVPMRDYAGWPATRRR